jgi:hypothetical protein
MFCSYGSGEDPAGHGKLLDSFIVMSRETIFSFGIAARAFKCKPIPGNAHGGVLRGFELLSPEIVLHLGVVEFTEWRSEALSTPLLLAPAFSLKRLRLRMPRKCCDNACKSRKHLYKCEKKH